MEATMDQYIGLDVSLKDTAISIREDGRRIWRGKCPSDPKLLAQMIRRHAPRAKRVVFETGPLSTWFYHALVAEGIPAICIEARHAQKVLNETLNKTDANDADGLAQLAEAGFYKAVRIKSFDSMLTRTLVGARNQLLSISTQQPNPRPDEDIRSYYPQRNGMSESFWLGMMTLQGSYCHCLRHGATFAS